MNTETLLGAYEVRGFLSAVGLDDLYLGTDTRDGGEVVIRLLPVFFDEDAVIQRLQARARKIASLDEPGLLFVTEVTKSDGAVLAVTPRPHAQAVDLHLPPDGLLPGDVFGVSLGLVTAIAALHRAGHVHGYLHAGRVLVTEDHDVRVLTIGPEEVEEPPSVRVAAYRPPERWAGQEIDACGEVFSLGVLLHQIATAELPFAGDTPEELALSIQEDVPRPVREIRPDLPQELAVIVARCLKKNREHRYPSAEHVLSDLEKLKEAIVSGKVSIGRQAEHRTETKGIQQAEKQSGMARIGALLPIDGLPDMSVGWPLVAVAAIGIIFAFVIGYSLGGPGPGDTTREATHLQPATFSSGQELFPSLSADGSEMVFAHDDGGDWNLFILRAGEVHAVALTEDPAADYQPALSPDDTRVAFRSERDGGGIFTIDRADGTVRKLAAFGFNPSWSPDGSEIAVADASVFDSPYRTAPESRIWAIDASSGDRRQVTAGNGFQPSWSPNGGRVAFWWSRAGTGADIWTTPAEGGEPVAVTDDPATDWNPVWSPDGSYLYFSSDRSGSLDIWRVRIDEDSGRPGGPPEQVTASGSINGIHPAFASSSGAMAYVEATSTRRLYRIPFNAESGSAAGLPELLPGGPPNAAAPDLSADGERMAFVMTQGGQDDVYVADRDGADSVPVTTDKARDLHPRLSPDGKRVAFLSQRDGFYQLFTAAPDGSSPRQLTALMASRVSTPVWSRDGSGITLTIGTNMTPSYTLLFDADGTPDQVAATLHTTPSAETFEPNSWSRGGSRLAGDVRDGSGRRSGIAVLSVETGRYEQLTDFGMHPVWLRDGRRLLFQWGSRLYLLDTRSPEPREVFNSGGDILVEGFSVSGDDRWIYVSLDRREADAWLLQH